jgi:hypothetical protein
MLVFASPSFLFIHKPISYAAAQKQNKLFRIFKKYSSLHLALITESEFRFYSIIALLSLWGIHRYPVRPAALLSGLLAVPFRFSASTNSAHKY